MLTPDEKKLVIDFVQSYPNGYGEVFLSVDRNDEYELDCPIAVCDLLKNNPELLKYG